jgi:hypothetical protein
MKVGETFQYGKITYCITKIEEIAENLPALRKAMKASRKETKFYFAGKVLKDNSVSQKQGGMFYRFKITGSFLKV